MAQVRDKETSECIFEGTPLECVLLADEIGRDEVLFDDVGEAFDPDAVVKAQREQIDGLETLVADSKGDALKSAKSSLKSAKDAEALTKAKIDGAKKALKKARGG